MELIANFELAVPEDPADAVPLSASALDADQLLVYMGGLVPNTDQVFIGKEGVVPADGMPYPGGAYFPLAAELSTRGGYHLNRIFIVSAASGQVVRVQAWKDITA